MLLIKFFLKKKVITIILLIRIKKYKVIIKKVFNKFFSCFKINYIYLLYSLLKWKGIKISV
jgi:hypothetical protein